MSGRVARRKVVCFRVGDSLVMQEDVFTRVKPLKIRGGGISLAWPCAYSVLDDSLAIGVPQRIRRLEFNSYATSSSDVCHQTSVDRVRT